MFVWVQVLVYVCGRGWALPIYVNVNLCLEVRGQPQVSSTLLFETVSPISL